MLEKSEDTTGEESIKDDRNPELRLNEEKGRDTDLQNRLKYLQADFENYRKRTEKEKREIEENSSRDLVSRLLNVLDELDLAVKHAKEAVGRQEMQEGIEMVQKNLYSALESAGLHRIDSVGQAFDPTRHEAVEKVQGQMPGSDIVVGEVRAGYAFRGRVIRPSMVKVQLALKEPVEAGNTNE